MSPIYLIIAIIINNASTYLIVNNTKTDLTMGPFCEGDRNVFFDCNVCKCFYGYLTECTRYRCNYKKGQTLYVNCLDDEMKIDNCYLCFCRVGFWQCSVNKVCDNVDKKPEEISNNRGLRAHLIRFGDDDDDNIENGPPPPPCVRVNQFTFECNSSRVGTKKTSEEQLDNIP